MFILSFEYPNYNRQPTDWYTASAAGTAAAGGGGSSISPSLSRYANTINSSILTIHLTAEDLLDVKNMLNLKMLSNEQLEKVDGTLRNVINALYDVKRLLN
jgi:hypothetical protein